MIDHSLRARIINALDQVFGYPDDAIHFLHVPKTAGSQIKFVANRVNRNRLRNRIRVHAHDVRLMDLPRKQRYFFSTRDPITRFRSAFHWRVEKRFEGSGKVRSAQEVQAFQLFTSANDLAEALFLPDQTGMDAALAMKSIRHVSRNLVDSFSLHGFDLVIRPPVWIIRIEHFQADLAEFLRRIGHPGPVDLDRDDRSARKLAYDTVPPLSDLAKQNLRRWYAQDFEFLRNCHAWLASNGAEPSAPSDRDLP